MCSECGIGRGSFPHHDLGVGMWGGRDLASCRGCFCWFVLLLMRPRVSVAYIEPLHAAILWTAVQVMGIFFLLVATLWPKSETESMRDAMIFLSVSGVLSAICLMFYRTPLARTIAEQDAKGGDGATNEVIET